MAYRRALCSRATVFGPRFNPCFSYLSHQNQNQNHSDDHTKSTPDPGFRFAFQNTSSSSFRGFHHTSTSTSTILGGCGLLLNGFGGHTRYMSTSVGDASDNADFLSHVSEVVPDLPADVIASQAPVISEVAIAAADSAIPVAALQYLIDGVHSFTGLNWAASIALTTLMIRGATVPFLINQLKSTYKLSIMRPRLEEIKEEMEAKGDDPTAMTEGKQKMNALFREYGVTPFTPLKGLLIQGPVFISFFLAISNMAEKVPSFKNGGAFWFIDLTTPDAMYIFPLLTALSFLINVEFNMQEGLEGNPIAGTMKKFSRVFAVLTVPFTMSFPKAIFCYWITSNIFSFAYGSVLKLPGVKKTLGIPEMPVGPPTKTKQGTQSGFSLFEALKQAAASKSTAAAEQPKPAVVGKTPTSSPSSAVLSQRLKSLERQVKQRKKNKRR